MNIQKTSYPVLISLVASVFFALMYSCKKPTEPPPPIKSADTTSHDFIWRIDTLGDSGILYDVAIIDEKNIWAVGEIYLKDASGQVDPLLYNAAQWDGRSWNVRRVPYAYQGENTYSVIRTVFAFSANDVWFAGNGVMRWNGQQYVPMEIPTSVWGSYWVNKLWGSSSSDVYIVGEGGSIAQYNGSSWQKIESGTNITLTDIWGEGTEILAVGSNRFQSLDRVLVRISGSTSSVLSDSGIRSQIVSVWFKGGGGYYMVGDGIYRKKRLIEPVWEGYAYGVLTVYYSNRVRGVDTNDVFIVGAFGDFLHYNGSTWKSMGELQMNGSFFGLAVGGNRVSAVGAVGSRAIAAMGSRR